MKALNTQVELLDRHLDSLQDAIDVLREQIALSKANQIIDQLQSEKSEWWSRESH